MIWLWIIDSIVHLFALLVPPSKGTQYLPHAYTRFGSISINAKCLCCGHEDGMIQTVAVPIKSTNHYDVFVQHTCKVCKARWYDKPLVPDANNRIHPSEVLQVQGTR